jgi:hypothetical protein
MKRQPGFDFEFVAKGSRPWWSIRSIGLLMILVAVIGLVLAVGMGIREQKPVAVRPAFPVMAIPAVLVQPATPPVPPDRFVRLADTSIDPQMVIPAPADLDDEMVINPEGRRARRPAILLPPASAPDRPQSPDSAANAAPPQPR